MFVSGGVTSENTFGKPVLRKNFQCLKSQKSFSAVYQRGPNVQKISEIRSKKWMDTSLPIF